MFVSGEWGISLPIPVPLKASLPSWLFQTLLSPLGILIPDRLFLVKKGTYVFLDVLEVKF